MLGLKWFLVGDRADAWNISIARTTLYLGPWCVDKGLSARTLCAARCFWSNASSAFDIREDCGCKLDIVWLKRRRKKKRREQTEHYCDWADGTKVQKKEYPKKTYHRNYLVLNLLGTTGSSLWLSNECRINTPVLITTFSIGLRSLYLFISLVCKRVTQSTQRQGSISNNYNSCCCGWLVRGRLALELKQNWKAVRKDIVHYFSKHCDPWRCHIAPLSSVYADLAKKSARFRDLWHYSLPVFHCWNQQKNILTDRWCCHQRS